MRNHFPTVVLLLCSVLASADAQNKKVDVRDAVVSVTRTSTTSEQLVSLSRSAKVNIIADSTSFSSDKKDSLLQKENKALQQLLEIAYTHNLSLRQTDNRTFLIWSEPDTTTLVKALVVESQKVARKPEDKPGVQPVPNDFGVPHSDTEGQKAGLFLADHLKRAYKWDGQSANIRVEFNLSELPPENAGALLNVARKNITKANDRKQKSWSSDAIWLSDDVWRSARIGYFQTPNKEMVLAVRGTDGQRDYFLSVGDLTTSSKTNWHPTGNQPVPQGGNDQQAGQKLTLTALQNEKPLDLPISLELTEAPLKVVLAEMQKDGGVSFTIAPDVLPNKTVTASISDMLMHDVMNALTGLYGISWVKAHNGYVATSGLSPAQVDALQLGDYQWFHYWKEPLRRAVAPPELKLPELVDLKAALADADISKEQLLAPQGVEMAALPEKLQVLIRQNIEGQVAPRLVEQYRNAFIGNDDLSGQDASFISIRVSPPTGRVVVSSGIKSTDVTPPLSAAVLSNGKEVYSLAIYGQQARQGILAQIQQFEALQEKLNPQKQTGNDPN